MKTRKKSRRRPFASRNPVKRTKRRSALKHVLFLNSPGKKSRRRGRSRSGFTSRNPVRRMSGRRGFTRSNPASGFIQSVFNQEMFVVGGGVVLGTVGTSLILNKLLLPDASGKVPLKLPGVDVTKPGYMNSFPVAVWRLGISAAAGYFLKDRAPRLAQGIIIGGVSGAISDLTKRSGILATIQGGTMPASTTTTTNTTNSGAQAFLPNGRSRARGMSTWVAGVSPVLTGPGTQFIPNGTRQPMRNGMSATVGRRWMNRTVTGAPNFAKPN